MAEAKFEIKGWPGAIIALILIGIFVYVSFFKPRTLDKNEKKVIKQQLEYTRLGDISKISEKVLSGERLPTESEIKKIKDSAGEIKITSFKINKGIIGRKKVKVEYTLNGKIPEDDQGIRYFSISKDHEDEGNLVRLTNRKRRVWVTEIDAKSYNRWW